MSHEDLAKLLIDNDGFNTLDKFSLLRDIAKNTNNTNDLAILVAMRLESDEWGSYSEIAANYVRSKGLFPYLSDKKVSGINLRDQIARDFFESPSRQGTYMHRSQYAVLNRLLSGESVILSAPTSFGKSYIIEELLRSGNFKNVVIIVPTIALIEEFRGKVKKLHTNHKRISFAQQKLSEENVFILTQERAFDMYPLISTLTIDLLIIDEFYKMDQSLLDKDDSDRANLLNIVYRNFSSIAEQVYLLGPFIDGIEGLNTKRHSPVWIESKDNTTYIVKRKLVAKRDQRLQVTCETAVKSGGEVMIYCSSPGTLRKLYIDCLSKSTEVTNNNDDLIEWINTNIGPEWYISDALRHGVGVHHGKLPRFLAHEMIKRFSDGRIKILLCTSSLIEGVNTNAKTIIIHNSQTRFNGDILTFRNISGRAGRMFKHFWGTVYYYEEPASNEVIVSDAIGSDNSDTSLSVLSLVDDGQLSDKQAQAVEEQRTQSQLPWEILQQNKFINISKQLEVIESLNDSPKDAAILGSISSSQLNSAQLRMAFKYASMLGLNTFKYAPAQKNNLDKSIIRLSIFINAYFNEGFRALASQQNIHKKIDDDAIENAFSFLKNGMAYDFPKYLRALNRLQSYVLGRDSGELEPLANRLEYLDTSPVYIQLDELGLPIELSQKYKLNTESTDLAVSSLHGLLDKLRGYEKDIAIDFLSRY